MFSNLKAFTQSLRKKSTCWIKHTPAVVSSGDEQPLTPSQMPAAGTAPGAHLMGGGGGGICTGDTTGMRRKASLYHFVQPILPANLGQCEVWPHQVTTSTRWCCLLCTHPLRAGPTRMATTEIGGQLRNSQETSCPSLSVLLKI